jgi:hypothetical protein
MVILQQHLSLAFAGCESYVQSLACITRRERIMMTQASDQSSCFDSAAWDQLGRHLARLPHHTPGHLVEHDSKTKPRLVKLAQLDQALLKLICRCRQLQNLSLPTRNHEAFYACKSNFQT